MFDREMIRSLLESVGGEIRWEVVLLGFLLWLWGCDDC